MMTRTLLFFMLPGWLAAAPIIPPADLFQDSKFLRDFVGSYGFLSDVEPKVTSDEQAALLIIRELFEQSKFREAEQQLALFIRETEAPSDPKKAPATISPAMTFVLGNLYFQADRADDARKAFLEAIRKFPRFRRAHTNLAYLYISKNQTDEALPMLQKAIELGENSARVYGLLGYCLLLKNNPIAAEGAYRQANLLDSASRDWKLGLAQALIAQENHIEAASMLNTLIEANPNDKQLWLQQTQAYLASERNEDAIINLEALRVKGLADETNLNLLGNLHMNNGQPQLALAAYLEAMERSPQINLERSLKSARILNDYGSPERAEQLTDAVRRKIKTKLSLADETALRLTEVRIAQAQNNPQRTGELLAELLKINPANPEVLLEYGRHQDLLSRDEKDEALRTKFSAEARTHYQLATRFEETSYKANLALGQLFVREKRYEDAMPFLQAALNVKKSESLEQYVSRVQRAADREKPADK